MPVIPALEILRPEDNKLQASLGYIVRPCLKKIKKEGREIIIRSVDKLGRYELTH
jgi:hypothetical protein